jgi:hypothetical protein
MSSNFRIEIILKPFFKKRPQLGDNGPCPNSYLCGRLRSRRLRFEASLGK